jgi:hypothetical protein
MSSTRSTRRRGEVERLVVDPEADHRPVRRRNDRQRRGVDPHTWGALRARRDGWTIA